MLAALRNRWFLIALVAAGNLALMIVLVALLHIVLLVIGLAAAQLLNFSRPNAIAVGTAGSQKTIMAGLFLATKFGALAILPMVAYHASQLVLDTMIADWLRERYAGREETAASPS